MKGLKVASAHGSHASVPFVKPATQMQSVGSVAFEPS